MSAYDRVIDALQAHGSRGHGAAWQCPAHDDRTASLSVNRGRKGALVNCQAGCATKDVAAALGLPWGDLFDEALEMRDRSKTDWIASYEYTDERGAVLFVKERGEPKTFRIFRPLTGGRRQYKEVFGGANPPRRVLYRLPAVLDAIRDGRTVYVVEGEKDVHAAEKAGAVATCNYDGAAKEDQRPKWRPEYGDALKGAHVVIVADNDSAGYAHAAAVHADLEGKAASVRVVRGLVDAEKSDLTDHLRAGHALDALMDVDPGESPADRERRELEELAGNTVGSRPTNPKTPGSVHMPEHNQGSGTSGTHSEGHGWENPVSIDTRKLPPLPVEHLGKLGAFVTATAASLQVAPDLVAFASLATISTATGGRRRVQVKPGWSEALALYMAALADSSEKKTPALDAAAAPLREMEDELIDGKRGEIEAKAQEIRIETARMSKAEQAAASDDPDKRNAGKADAEAAQKKLLELGDSAELPRLLIRDATMEALVKRMHEQGGRIGSLASEANLLKIAGGMYSQNGQANTDLLLEAYTGSAYSVDRAGRPAIRMRSTFLALAFLIQSGVLAGLAKKNPEFRENGLLGRFLYSRPEPTEEDTFDSPETPPEISDGYSNGIKNIVRKVWDTEEVSVMRLSEGARKAFAEFYNSFSARRKKGGDLHEIAEWAGKLRGQVIRLAACLALYENPDSLEIGEDRIRGAIALVPYLVAHAKSVYDLMDEDSKGRLKPARDLLEWIRTRPEPGQADTAKGQTDRTESFRAREAWQALKGRGWAKSMDDMNDAIKTLEDLGWVAYLPEPERPEGTRGRKPSPMFDVHPWVHTPPKVDGQRGDSHPTNPIIPNQSHPVDVNQGSGISGMQTDYAGLGPNIGPCERCEAPTLRHGPYGNPLCNDCRTAP